MSTLLPISAYILGAQIIEKHFTDNIKLKRTDYQSALDAKNLKKFVNEFNLIHSNYTKKNNNRKYENNYRLMFKKVCVINKNKRKGEKIKISDFDFKKKKINNSYLFSHSVVGKKLNSEVELFCRESGYGRKPPSNESSTRQPNILEKLRVDSQASRCR